MYDPKHGIRAQIREQEELRARRHYEVRVENLKGANKILSYWLNVAMAALVDIKCFSTDASAKATAQRAHSVYRAGIRPFQETPPGADLLEFADAVASRQSVLPPSVQIKPAGTEVDVFAVSELQGMQREQICLSGCGN